MSNTKKKANKKGVKRVSKLNKTEGNLHKIMFNNRQAPIDEEWKYIKGYEHIYKISNYGLVINAQRHNKIIGTYYNNKCNDKHYNVVSLHKDGKEKVVSIHRLVALAFVDNPNQELCNSVNHIDGNIRNNYYKNLEWVSCVNSNKYINTDNIIKK